MYKNIANATDTRLRHAKTCNYFYLHRTWARGKDLEAKVAKLLGGEIEEKVYLHSIFYTKIWVFKRVGSLHKRTEFIVQFQDFKLY